MNRSATISRSPLFQKNPYLYRTIPLARNLQSNPLPPLIQHHLSFYRHHRSRLLRRLIFLRLRQLKDFSIRNRQEATVERFREIAVVAADGVVYGYEVGACRKGSFDHYLGERRADGGQDVAAPEHRRANGHEVCDCMGAIADELLGVRIVGR